jgi:hypothetical protein
MATSLSGAYEVWSQGVRDNEFLVEMRLQNLEPQEAPKHEASPTRPRGEVVEVIGGSDAENESGWEDMSEAGSTL